MIDDTVEQIREEQIQSTSIAAVKAAEALRELVTREYHTVEDFMRSLVRNSRALRQANQSHAMLYTTQQRIIAEVNEFDPETVDAAQERLEAVVREIVIGIKSSKEQAAETAATLIEDGDVLLTHGYSSTVVATLNCALESGKQFELYVTESRPQYLGRKMARRFANRDGIDVTLIVDGAVGYYLSEADRVVVGMNCVIGETVYNHVGTYPLVATAASEGVPVTVVGPASKFIGSGFEFSNEFGLASEVLLEPAEGFDIGNPAYDSTPTRLLETVVTEDGVMRF
ncbi:translation initiation factor eIF-2B subunit delta [Halogranum amylolyticum]|uniref:Translation initiation factor eIF-2B subunit delta n=1 Tax=Halogranum amylolyticum TaxID=660520 RepID=A0A1H8TG20_9EURY|nr:translation initiation factor eIF-2B [Halogranum amylolyticum]SEO90079.1 translation initiation factor eIF-2B subunit delta [Halogranum amylolyticum]